MNGGWFDYKFWFSWFSCDKFCGIGIKMRVWIWLCDNFVLKYSGKIC